MQIRSPQHLITNIDIVDRASSTAHPEYNVHGSLVSIDLNCPADLFFGRKNLVAKFSFSFTTQIQDGFHKPVAIQHAEVGYYAVNNDIKKLLDGSNRHDLAIKPETFKDGKADIEMPQPYDNESNDFINIRIVVLLNAYPSNMELSASMASLSTTDGKSRPSRAFTSVPGSHITPSPNETRLQRLLYPYILDMEDEFGMTPFSCAASAGQTSVIRRALHQRGSISAREKTTRGPSPLEAAALRDDTEMLVSFLVFLKYFATLRDEIPELDKIPPLEKLPALEEKDIEDEIRRAVDDNQTAVIEKLVLMRLKGEAEKEEWLAHQMVKAAEAGALSLVQVLKSCGAQIYSEVDVVIDGEVDYKTTPLMSAINHDRTRVAEFLIIHGAGNEDALRIAVKNRQHSIIRALLQAGIVVKGDFKMELLNVATAQKDSTTLMLLDLENGTGKLATSQDLEPAVDEHFEATVVTFQEDKPPDFEEFSVAKLMQKSSNFFSLNNRHNKFKWFHLPANNKQKALIGKIYHEDPSLAYKVLEPKRWVKRQHEGERGSPHARFMMPACHDFSEAFKDKKSESTLRLNAFISISMRVQMPYLHWDEEDAVQRRSKYLAETPWDVKTSNHRLRNESSAAPERIEKEKMLLKKYLLSEDHRDSSSRHVLHIRRTLDQYIYLNPNEAAVRDADQPLHRYQKKLNRTNRTDEKVPLILMTVDQLWLWILVDLSGKAKAIVTCFPSRDWSDVGVKAAAPPTQAKWILDRRRTTDVLQLTKSYIGQTPRAVKSPYDLADIIASNCSGALFSSPSFMNFAEVYENSIRDVRNEESLLFSKFNALMKARMKIMMDESEAMMINLYHHLANETAHDIISLQQQTNTTVDLSKEDQRYAYRILMKETNDDDDSENLPNDERKEAFIKLLEKIGYNILDITCEITILRQIKIMRNELQIMEKVFKDQTEVLEAMDEIIRTMEETDQRQSLSLRTVFRQSRLVKELIQHAQNPDLTVRTSFLSQLNLLINLKQEQSHMIDARAARLQAEQANKIKSASEKLNKTLMVFTVVTIIFLPLSFIAAFLAIPTKEFGTGTLSLDFVTKITFSISAAISILLIAIGFAAADWRFEWLKKAISLMLARKTSKSDSGSERGLV
ncbi:hypothetical protein V8C40DRAFT_282089 [Trichoderma camerunense]